MKNNRKILCIVLILISFSAAFGQTTMFQKIIEPVQYVGSPNLRSKDVLQRKFFPDNNGIVEFFEVPSFNAPYGFRLTHTTDDHYILEIKQITNWQEIRNRLDAEYPFNPVPRDLPENEREEMNRNNVENLKIRREQSKEAITEYEINSIDVNINKSLANEIYNAFILLIGNYKNRGEDYIIQPDGSKMIISQVVFDGSQMTFRCVVDNELWSLFIGKSFDEIGKLTKICNEMIQDVVNESVFDENKYIRQLKELVKIE